MPLPSVSYCVLCEDVRREVGNKLTLLGFFGILPGLKILLTPDEKSVKLVFLPVFGKGSGECLITSRVLTPQRDLLVTGSTYSLTFDPEVEGTAAVFVFSSLKLEAQGDYSFQLMTGEKEIYRASFNIIRGQIPTFS